MDAFLKKRTLTSGFISNFMVNFFKTDTEYRTQTFIRTRIELLHKYFETFSTTHYTISWILPRRTKTGILLKINIL